MPNVLIVARSPLSQEWDGELAGKDRGRLRFLAETDLDRARARLLRESIECVCLDLEDYGLAEGTALLEWAKEWRPDIKWLLLCPSLASQEWQDRLDGYVCVRKPVHAEEARSMLKRLLSKVDERRGFTTREVRLDRRNEDSEEADGADGAGLLAIHVRIREWRIPLAVQERQLLEFALRNAAEELVCDPLTAAMAPSASGFVALLQARVPASSALASRIKRSCGELARAASRHFYAELDIHWGELAALPADPVDGMEPEGFPEAEEPDVQAKIKALSASDNAVLERIFSYVDEHLLDELKREEIAELVHFHPVYLSRFFKSRTGTSLSQYIVNRRIEKAKLLLANSDLQVGHIVHRLGYYNSSHFTRTFKQATGFTPRQYRTAISLDSGLSSVH
ncbi:helix-turn-helix transcriptional regulator [Cohnella sp. AR92]|uniref:helix-turn-helix transcriptional regulator n=1 Tax=Cohnella sp. AR92 TaxID=648716 RepID=UPI000F8DECFD|nr:AraC family transcriptional regulator [Cohnella sp. AR92]RUS47808.1 AraC family transcriptional regulator [Cohnella sp. AR92]